MHTHTLCSLARWYQLPTTLARRRRKILTDAFCTSFPEPRLGQPEEEEEELTFMASTSTAFNLVLQLQLLSTFQRRSLSASEHLPSTIVDDQEHEEEEELTTG